MKRLAAYAVAVIFLSSGLHAQQLPSPRPPSRANTETAKAFVRSFYKVVLAYPRANFPSASEMKVLEPYLSKSLLEKMENAQACGKDWAKRNPPPPKLKPPFGWLEMGLFSGWDERTAPSLYHVEGVDIGKDGSYQVNVRLRYDSEQDHLIWRVVAIVRREASHFVIDDVTFPKDPDEDADSSLTKVLADGCHGGHWTGYLHESPDKEFVSIVEPARNTRLQETTDGFVSIRDAKGLVRQRHDFTYQDGDGYRVDELEWTPDSQFCVFRLQSSAGHSPTLAPVVFWSRKTDHFYLLKDYTGDQIFSVAAPAAVQLTTWPEMHPATVSLSELRARVAVVVGELGRHGSRLG